MPVVSDFTTIHWDDNGSVKIGPTTNDKWQENFNTGGRHAAGSAYIIIELRRLKNSEDALVEVNGDGVGLLTGNKGGPDDQWQTQILSFKGSTLKDGNNAIKVTPRVSLEKQCQIRNVICHFHQDT
jgi:hypothetical protein